jgi:excisionase family DNA binding protein
MIMVQAEPIAFTIEEAVAASKLSRSEIYRAFNRGDLTAKKNGRRTLILREDLVRFLTALPNVREAA